LTGLFACQVIDVEFARPDALHDIPFYLFNIGLSIPLNLYLMGSDDFHLVFEYFLLDDCRFLWLVLADL
jgi:hypothetical protein